MTRFKHVAVLMGGWSSEREVSLRSGKACADALERKGYRVTRIDVKRDIATVLDQLKPDAALVMLHGRPGEDGTIQGVLETLPTGFVLRDVALLQSLLEGIPLPRAEGDECSMLAG